MNSKMSVWITGIALLICALALHAQPTAFVGSGVRRDCLQQLLGRPGLSSRHTPIPPEVMDRLCRLAISRTQPGKPASGLGRNEHRSMFTIFDPPGSVFTLATALEANGEIIGNYADANGVSHGFVRAVGGEFTTIDMPGAADTIPTAISPSGVIAGYYDDAPGSVAHGFLRARGGSFTSFDAPPGASLEVSTYNFPGSAPPGIDAPGDVVGTYRYGFVAEHGFLLTRQGGLVIIDVPGAEGATQVLSSNAGGLIAGIAFLPPCGCGRGFVRTQEGTFIEIGPPGDFISTFPFGINAAGATTGNFGDFENNIFGGFVQTAEGAFTVFNPPGSGFTNALAINPAGAVTGYYCDDIGCHGYVRDPKGLITPFDPPGSTFTIGTAIGPNGAVTGGFLDVNGQAHGFLYRP